MFTANYSENEESSSPQNVFRELVEYAPLGIFCTTGDDELIFANTAMAQMLGYGSVEELSHALDHIDHRFYVEPVRLSTLKDVLMCTGRIDHFENRIHHRDGHIIWVSESARIAPAHDGEGIVLERFVKDITEAKKREKYLLSINANLRLRMRKRVKELLLEMKRRRRAQEALKAAMENTAGLAAGKGQFLANVSHELRTPLNAIIGFAQTIQAEIYGPLCPDQYREYVDIIAMSGRHLKALIDDILDLSKIDSGMAELDLESVDIHTTLSDCMRLVEQRAQAAKIEMETSFMASMDVRIEGDGRRIRQIFLNLLSNALKFTPVGGTVFIETDEHKDNFLIVSVRDTGVGISPQDIPKVLSEYGQVGRSLNIAEEGTGLGLPISKKLVEMHGGTLTIQSERGKGARISVSFPLK